MDTWIEYRNAMKFLVILATLLGGVVSDIHHSHYIHNELKTNVFENKQKFNFANDVEPYLGEGMRLPSAWTPTRYFLKIQGFINGNKTIDGYVEIDFIAEEATDNITLNIYDVSIDFATVSLFPIDDPSSSLQIFAHTYDYSREFYRATMAEPLDVGRSYRLQINYQGEMQGLEGFYVVSYDNTSGETINVGATQMQPTDARRTFPCFDEPALKATFETQLAREADSFNALSNMPLVNTYPDEDQPGWVWDVFEASPVMSTYLNAFCISDFISIEDVGNNLVTTRIWGQAEDINAGRGDYALETSKNVLDALQDYFTIPYPIDKCDHVALPSFGGGAMENWGLILYIEGGLLWDPIIDTDSSKSGVAVLIGHELAHMWFGNLVTLEWWGETWLNEGFATYLQYLGLDPVETDFLVFERFTTENTQIIFQSDDFEGSVPLKREVENRTEIGSMFDGITYNKGASVIYMMNYFLTENTMRAGLINYLNGLSYGSATQDILFDYLTQKAHADRTLDISLTVKNIMDTWTLQPGYPLITITDNGDGTATLNQERYLQDADENATMYTYYVPISYTTGDNPDFSELNAFPATWMSPAETQKTIFSIPSDTWHIFNLLQTAFYRVNYGMNNWQRISDQLDSDYTIIAVRNRAQVMDDPWKFAIGGRLIYDVPLLLTQYLKNEQQYAPWTSAIRNLGYINDMFREFAEYENLQRYLRSIVLPQYERLGFIEGAEDAFTQRLLRTLMASWACDLDYVPCLSDSSALYSQLMADPIDYTIVPPNMKPTIYCAAISEGGDEEWNFALNRFSQTVYEVEQEELRDGMTCSKNSETLQGYLDMTFSNSSVFAESDADNIFNGICNNNDGGNDIAWAYLEDNYHDIANFYDGSYHNVQVFARYCARNYNTQEELDKVQNFYDTIKPDLDSENVMIGLIDTIESNIEWVQNYFQTINDWLINNNYGSPIL